MNSGKKNSKNIFLNLAKALFPINRSITGRGVRKTLKIIKEKYLPNLKIREVRSGTKVFDWKVPPEWNIKDAYLKDEEGKKIIELKIAIYMLFLTQQK